MTGRFLAVAGLAFMALLIGSSQVALGVKKLRKTDIGVSVSVFPAAVSPGTTADYYVSVTNYSRTPARAVSLVGANKYPCEPTLEFCERSVRFLSFESTQGTCAATDAELGFACSVGTLPARRSVNITVSGLPSAGPDDLRSTWTAIAFTNTLERYYFNNAAEATVYVAEFG